MKMIYKNQPYSVKHEKNLLIWYVQGILLYSLLRVSELPVINTFITHSVWIFEPIEFVADSAL